MGRETLLLLGTSLTTRKCNNLSRYPQLNGSVETPYGEGVWSVHLPDSTAPHRRPAGGASPGRARGRHPRAYLRSWMASARRAFRMLSSTSDVKVWRL